MLDHTSNNAVTTYQRCPRKLRYSHIQRRVSVSQRGALELGTAYHDGAEQWDTTGVIAEPSSAEWPTRQGYALARRYAEVDPLRDTTILAYEREWSLPMPGMPPAVGRLDAAARIDGEVWLVEHKTASSLSPNDDYVRMMSPQAMLYMCAARAGAILPILTHAVGVLYLTMVKSGTKRKLATPPDKRYKKDGGLRANVRMYDEGDNEYLERWAGASKLERSPLRFTDDQLHDYWRTYTEWARRIIADKEYPMALGKACSDYGICEYFDVCAGIVNISDNTFYKDKDQ